MFDNIEKLKHNPPVRSDQWCENQPCIEWGDWTISQPTSSVLVYVLALITIWVAYLFLKDHRNQHSRKWWGISLLLGGVGAFLAGTSFQAFGFMIKCSGKTICDLTSWWEIAYNILTVWGAGALLIAIAYSSMNAQAQKWSKAYAFLSSLIYTVVCLVGAFKPNAFMVSFELMILFSLPIYVYIILLHFIQLLKNKSQLVKRFLYCWGILALTLAAYYFYLTTNITQILWTNGIWFSENDVLHVLMIVWCFYIYFYLLDVVEDCSLASSASASGLV